MNPAYKKQMLLTVFFLFLFGGLAYGGAEGKITLKAGDVFVNGNPAKVGDVVKKGDLVEVGKSSKCEITVEDDSILLIKNDARIVYNIDETETSSLDILKGWFAAVVKKRNVKIKTPTAIAGIRGTAICLKVEEEESTYGCTCNGTIHWQGKGHEKGEVVTASHHSGRRFKMVDGAIVKTPAKMTYHTDKDVEELASKIGVKIDWTKAE